LAPGPGVAGIRDWRSSLTVDYTRGQHNIWGSADCRESSAPQYFPDAKIRGCSYRLGVGLSNEHFSASVVGVRRALHLYSPQGITAVPGSPSTELKTTANLNMGRHTLSAGLQLRSDYPFPLSRQSIARNLGSQTIGTIGYTVAVNNRLRIGLQATNVLKWTGSNNAVGAIGDANQMTKLYLPALAYVNAEFSLGHGR